MSNVPCPKCKSRSTHISRSRSPYIGNEPDMIFHCVTCGTRIYGPEKVKALVSAHEQIVQAAAALEAKRQEEERRWLAEQTEAERVRLEHEARAAKSAADAARREARRKAVEVEILSKAKCAWPPCQNDHTMTSRYCSRTCSNKNAHAREKAKKEAAKSL